VVFKFNVVFNVGFLFCLLFLLRFFLLFSLLLPLGGSKRCFFFSALLFYLLF